MINAPPPRLNEARVEEGDEEEEEEEEEDAEGGIELTEAEE
jgi:hypothetical protein